MQNNLPYIPDQVGLPILCQPYLFSDAKMATFFLDCQAGSLNQLLDTYINQPSRERYDYRCLGINGKAFALMIMAQMTVDARNPDGQLYGKERYSELSFWIPCYDRNALKNGEFKPALFLPFLFPDSFSAIATGREMFGFRKQLAQFAYPSGKLDLLRPEFTATTTAFKQLGADSVAQAYNFISLAGGSAAAVPESVWSDAAPAAEGMIEQFLGKQWTCAATGDVLGTIANDFLQDCPAIFLKQFPSIDDARQAEVRSIAAAPFQLLKFRGAFPWFDLKSGGLKVFDLQIERLASHPVVTQLGLTPQSASAEADIVPVKGFWIDVDFQLETGKTMLNVPPRKQKIAVLGGGLGSLAAVYGITEQPDWQQKYDITLYQLGWRLGGKGASGRNREKADRVEEHGLHIWFGYYENAFQMIQKCYAELARPANAPLATWQQAFKPQNTILVEEYVDSKWKNWALSFRPNDEVPGDGSPFDDHPRSFFFHLRDALGWLDDELHEQVTRSATMSAHVARHLVRKQPAKPSAEGLLDKALDVLAEPVEFVVEHEVEHFFASFRQLYQTFPQRGTASAKQADQLDQATLDHWHNVIEELQGLVEQLLLPFSEVIDSLRRIVVLAELALAIAKGILADGVLWKGYTAINPYDFVAWLEMHGASASAANSALVRSFYDLYLGFPNGQNEIVGDGVAIGGNVSAGELLHSYVLVTLCYKGAIMWKMQAGMGDTVMTPLYQVLKQRGVRFEFFHQVSDLKLTPDRTQIGEIALNVQATLKPGLAQYNPLYDVKGLACWPSAPLYDQLEQGEELKRRQIDLESSWSPWQPVAQKSLKLGEDFDQVVLGISVAALPCISAELTAASPSWKTMLEKAATSQTQAMQLWLNVTLEETGWPLASPVLDAYGEPFNTWAPMDQTLDKENWPQNALPFGVGYFCNNMKDAVPIPPFSDHSFPETQKERVKQDALQWLQHYTGHLWPYATQAENSNALDWSKLVDLDNRSGAARLDGQYFRANIEPTERYVCNAADTNQYRLKAGGSTFANLTLTGDWVDNGSLNLGCVESTVIAGLQAARAVTGGSVPIHHETIFNA